MDIQKIRQKLNIQKNRIGLVGGSIKIEEYDELEHNISAHISPQGWAIEVSLKKGFNPIQDRRQKAYARIKKIEDGLETIITDITCHEFTHWQLPNNSKKGCPYDSYNHDKILEAIKQNLPQDKQIHVDNIANAFEDIICNSRAKEWKGDFSGQVLFWDNEGVFCKSKGQKDYTPFYESFVKLNMHLWGDSVDTALLKRYYSNNKEIEKAVNNVISDLNLPKNIQDTTALFNRENWPKMAGKFAKNLAILLKQSPTERLSAFSKKIEINTGTGNRKGEYVGNGISEKAKTKEGKEEIAYGRYISGNRQSTNFTSYEQLDALYRKLAKPLTVRIEAMTKTQGLNISTLTYKPFNPETDEISRVKFSKLFMTEQGLQFAYPNQPLSINTNSKVQIKNFPDFKMIILDNSESMTESMDGSGTGKTEFIPWGDNSKYHFALLGFYGIEDFLQNQGIAQYIQHGLLLFSSHTRLKQVNFSEIDKIRKLALTPEFRGTRLDVKPLEQALTGKESFILSLSDGEIENWDSEKNKFKILTKGNHYTHIQIGKKTLFSRDLESWDVPVSYIKSRDDLSKLMVDVTKKTYEGFIKK